MFQTVGSAGERQRQPKPREHAVVEASHGADPITSEGEDKEAGPVAGAGRGSNVGTKGKLTVGSHRWHEVVGPAALAKDAGVEAGHHVDAFVFERDWRHGNADILSEQGHETVYIAGFVGTNKLLHERPLGR